MKRKRGVTLAEMIIVMAIVTIMTLMVISFTVICNGWVHIGIERYRLTQSERSLSAALRDFVSYYDNENYDIAVVGGNTLRASDKNDAAIYYDFVYDKEKETVSYELPDKKTEYPLEYVSELRIMIRKSEKTGRAIINCCMLYSLPATNASVLSNGTYNIIVTTQT